MEPITSRSMAAINAAAGLAAPLQHELARRASWRTCGALVLRPDPRRCRSSWFHERRSGELVGRLASDVTVVEGVVGSELSMALRNSIQMIGGLVLLVIIDVKLTLLMLAIVPPIVVTTIIFGRQHPQDDARGAGRAREGVGPGAGVDRRDRDGAGVRARGLRGRALPRAASSTRSAARSIWSARGRGSSRRR